MATTSTVRALVYEVLAREGRAPSIAELARRAAVDEMTIRARLLELAEAHAVVLSPDGDAIRMAHPFSAAPMAFVVTPADGLDDRRWWGGCAWDSFGISAALSLEVRIDTACPQCGDSLGVTVGPTTPPLGSMVVRFPRPAAQWWDDVVATCRAIRMFCDAEHASVWADRHAPGTGYVADVQTVWALAGPWYGDRLDAGFVAHSREHNQRLLHDVGLTGPFWALP